MNNFTLGFKLPFQGIKFLKENKKLWKYSLIPMLINIIVFVVLGYLSFHYLMGWLAAKLLTTWYLAILFYLFLALAISVFAIIIAFIFSAIYNIIAAPFNDLLSEKVEELVKNKKIEEKFSLKLLAGDIFRTVLEEVKKLLLFGGVQILLLFLNLLPIIGNLAYAVLSFVFTCWFLAYEYVDYPMARKRMEFKEKKGLLLKNKGFSFGFGLATFILIIIPVLNLIFMPACVVAGTLAYLKLKDEKSEA